MILVYVYPANDVVGGTIEIRNVVKISGNKALFDKVDKYGYMGCRLGGIYISEEQAEQARAFDLRNEDTSD